MLKIERFPGLKALSLKAAELICQLAKESVGKGGLFTLVLSGGTTPRLLYKYLTSTPFNQIMPWSHTHVFWGDERFVPSGHPDNNYSLAHELLISKVPLPPQNIHRIHTEVASPEDAAKAYEKDLKQFFASFRDTGELTFPDFDVILLGVGSDGHTASLFPGDKVLHEKKRWVTAVTDSKGLPPVPRITLTLPVINNADCVMMLASGAGKKNIVQSILDNPETAQKMYPAAMVNPRGNLLWLIDEMSD